MGETFLSVCIPTYQRARTVGATIASVLAQGGPDVEVVVSDNASTDGTEAIVRGLEGGSVPVRYFRLPENRGADFNYLEVVRRATGRFCWLLGSDDWAAPGAVAALRAALAGERADVVLFDRVNLDAEMRTALSRDRFLSAPDGTLFDCARVGELERYLAAATSLGGVFSYISAFVVRRALWDAVPDRTDLVGSAYVHAAKMLDVLSAGARLLYLSRPLVQNRTENDSFQAALGIGRRRKLDFNYVAIADAVFASRPPAREALVRALERDVFRLVQLMWDKRMAAAAGGGREIEALREGYAALRGRPGWRAKMLAFEAIPPLALEAAYRAAVPLARALRRLRLGAQPAAHRDRQTPRDGQDEGQRQPHDEPGQTEAR